jgi:hypothetical protein
MEIDPTGPCAKLEEINVDARNRAKESLIFMAPPTTTQSI